MVDLFAGLILLLHTKKLDEGAAGAGAVLTGDHADRLAAVKFGGRRLGLFIRGYGSAGAAVFSFRVVVSAGGQGAQDQGSGQQKDDAFLKGFHGIILLCFMVVCHF